MDRAGMDESTFWSGSWEGAGLAAGSWAAAQAGNTARAASEADTVETPIGRRYPNPITTVRCIPRRRFGSMFLAMNPNPLGPEELRAIRTMARTGAILGWILLAIIVLSSMLGPYTDWLWFTQDVRLPQVFTATYSLRGQLFLGALLVSWALLHFSLNRALKVSMVFIERPGNLERMMMPAIRWMDTKGPTFFRFFSFVVAFLVAGGFSHNWMPWVLARNAVPFERTDPMYGRDLSFFVFQLPWWKTLADAAFGLLLVTLLLTAALYAGIQAMALFARIELGRPQIRTHLSLLIGGLIVALGVRIVLGSYEAGLVPGTQFTGAGYAASFQARMQMAVGWIAVGLGVLTLATVRTERPFRVPAIGGGVVAGLAVILLGVVPSILQAVVVNPDKLNKEGPYANRAIQSTRWAYMLDQIEIKDMSVSSQPTRAEVDAARPTLDNMRLWDPEIYRQSIENIQGLRPYYTFHDVDIDRYEIDGKKRMVMLAPRDIRLEGLSANARTWVNQRLQYTHGYGVVMSPVNASTEMGQPTFLMRDIPTISTGPKLEQPRLYFSDFRDSWGNATSEYAIVNTNVEEFDYPQGERAAEHRWTGDRGIRLASPLVRGLFALRLGDGNLMVSGNITPNSRLLLRRSILERAQAVFPFLLFDQDPYIVVSEGRARWILDAYTATNQVPYSYRIGGARGLNYLRNSVKIVIDAYTGDMRAYQFAEEPLIQAWRKIFPGLIQARDAFPAGLEGHIRYPEDLLQVQSIALQEYHVTEPIAFLNNGDAWEIGSERGLSGSNETMRPYYVQMVLPGQKEEEFLQIIPFTPRSKPNMSGWLAAKCDPKEYGRLLLYRYTRGTLINGPAQMEAIFNQDRVVADINRQFNNEQSQILVGNLLVVPIGNSVMYVEPLFLRSRTSGIQAPPELKKVILAFQNKVVVGDTYEEAKRLLFSGTPAAQTPSSQGEPQPATSPSQATETGRATRALQLFQQADQALRGGDFARYGDLQKQLKAELEALVEER